MLHCSISRAPPLPLLAAASPGRNLLGLLDARYGSEAPTFCSGFHTKPRVCAATRHGEIQSGAFPKSLMNLGWGARVSFATGSGRVLPWISEHGDGRGDVAEGAKTAVGSTGRSSSWERSAEKFFARTGERVGRDVLGDGDLSKNEKTGEGEVEMEEESEPIDNPKWHKIKDKYRRAVVREERFREERFRGERYEKPEVGQWNRQENWGRKTWREAGESTVPKMVGQGIYGVGPVLAALVAGRREFYALYAQEGMDLSGSNKKKKDKKGAEKILQMAEKIGLKVVETSKHDLNMVVDNRPHQGLVLDASPLEMVNTRELEPVRTDGQKARVWVALDEVMDPQNLGAIIRSAYFFGVEGVVLCAKNSAPLSGVVSKASAGSLELIELLSCRNMMQFLSLSAENGWRVLGGSVAPKAIPITDIAAGEPTILVLGSEGTGLRPLVERSCTDLVRIPGNINGCVEGVGADAGEEDDSHLGNQDMKSFLAVESLNVSVAAGVLLYHLAGKSAHLASERPNAAFM